MGNEKTLEERINYQGQDYPLSKPAILAVLAWALKTIENYEEFHADLGIQRVRSKTHEEALATAHNLLNKITNTNFVVWVDDYDDQD